MGSQRPKTSKNEAFTLLAMANGQKATDLGRLDVDVPCPSCSVRPLAGIEAEPRLYTRLPAGRASPMVAVHKDRE
jgi:hypothetical protein